MSKKKKKKKLIIIKRAMIKNHHPLYGVDKGTILEPNNIYHRIVSVMKQSTQEYYNMRMILGLKCG